MDKEALEDELAAREESILVDEFKRNLEYNLKKVRKAGGFSGCRLAVDVGSPPGFRGVWLVQSLVGHRCVAPPLSPVTSLPPDRPHPIPSPPCPRRRAPRCTVAAARSSQLHGHPAAGACWSSRWARQPRRGSGSRMWRRPMAARG